MSKISPAAARPEKPTPSTANLTVCSTLKHRAMNSRTRLNVKSLVTGCFCVLKKKTSYLGVYTNNTYVEMTLYRRCFYLNTQHHIKKEPFNSSQ